MTVESGAQAQQIRTTSCEGEFPMFEVLTTAGPAAYISPHGAPLPRRDGAPPKLLTDIR
jgi:hypothetical protein